MKDVLRHVPLWLVITSTGVLGGCGGLLGALGGNTPVLSIGGPSTLAVDQGQSVSITVNVQHGGGQGVTWSCSGTACTATSLPSTPGFTVTFTANGPAGTATVTATSVKDTSVSASVTITVNLAPAVTTTQAQVTAVPATVGQHYSFTLSASGGAGTLSWTATGLPANGLTLSSAGVLSGTPTSAGTVVFTATVTDSSAGGSKSATSSSLTLTILSASSGPSIASLTPSSGVVGAPVTIAGTHFGTTQGTSTVTFNGTPATPTSWSDGSIVAPVPSAATTGNVVVTAGGVASNGVTFTVLPESAVCGSGSEPLLNGHYAILVSGFDNSQPVGVGAVFDADGAGHIALTAGAEDINSAGNLGHYIGLGIDSTKSSYSVGSDQRGCITLATVAGTGNPNPSPTPITITFRFSLGSVSSGVAYTGHIIEFDSTGSSGLSTAGYLLRQDTSAFSNSAINGSYAFGAAAREVGLGEFGIAGVFTTDGNGNVTSGEADYNTDNGGNLDGVSSATDFPANPLTFTAGGTYNIGTNGGRGGLGFVLSDGTGVNASVYVISSTELLILRRNLQNPPGSTNPLFAGRILKQSKSSFSTGDLNGSMVGYFSGLGSSGTRTSLGIVSASGSGTFSISEYQNDSGGLSYGSKAGGVYTVDASGRVLISGVGNHNTVLYLAGQNEGFTLDAAPNCQSGLVKPQNGAPFANGSFESPPPYTFGTIRPGDSHVAEAAGIVNSNGIGTLTGTSDIDPTGIGGSLTPGQSIDSTYEIDSTGVGVIPAGCTFTAGDCDLIFIVLSPPSGAAPFGRAVLMDARSSTNYPALSTAEQ